MGPWFISIWIARSRWWSRLGWGGRRRVEEEEEEEEERRRRGDFTTVASLLVEGKRDRAQSKNMFKKEENAHGSACL